jgi:hypothetical protein
MHGQRGDTGRERAEQKPGDHVLQVVHMRGHTSPGDRYSG